MSLQADGPVGNFLERKMWKHDDISYLPAVKYGLVSESTARLLFERDMGIERPGFRVLESGLWVHPRYPEMACSPDGLVMDPSERDTGMHGLLEIKCYLMLKHGRKRDFRDFTIEVIQMPDKKSGVKRSEKET